MSENKPQLVEELFDVLSLEFDDENLVCSVIDTLCSYLGGRQVYFPQNNSGLTQSRDAKLLKDRDRGVPMDELVKKYKMSEISVRRAMRREKDRLMQKNQQGPASAGQLK